MYHMSNCLEVGKVSVLLSGTRYIEFMILIMADPLALIMEGLELISIWDISMQAFLPCVSSEKL